MVRTESRDGGKTWSGGVDAPFPNPNAAVDFLRLQSGHHLLVYNDSFSERTPLTVALSELATRHLSSGTARITVSGPVSVDADGLVDASLMIKLKDPKAVATILAGAVPEHKSEIEQGFAAIAMLGKEPSLPLKIVKSCSMALRWRWMATAPLFCPSRSMAMC